MSVPKVFNSRRNLLVQKKKSASQAAVERNAWPPAGCSEQSTEIDRPASSVSIHCSSTAPAHADASDAMLRNSLSTRDRSIRSSGEPATSEAR